MQQLLFGPEHPALAAGHVVTLQTVGSSGGLRVGADFVRRWLPGSAVWVSDPTWDNHRAMFEGAGLTVNSYPYYDAATGGLDFDGMRATLTALPARSVVLMHACCHNPTGVDLTRGAVAGRWCRCCANASCCPTSTWPTRVTATASPKTPTRCACWPRRGSRFFVANSFSKSMSVYGERAGALSVVCADAAEATLVDRPIEGHRAAQLLEPGDTRRRHHQPRARPTPPCVPPGKPTWPA